MEILCPSPNRRDRGRFVRRISPRTGRDGALWLPTRIMALCGSGVGASIAANKVAGVRAGLIHAVFSAHQGVEDDDMNVFCLGGKVI